MPPHTLSRSILPVAMLIVLVIGVFSPTLKNQFVDWDDRNEIFQNPDFNPVTAKGLLWNWSHTRLSLYMPVTYMTWGAVAATTPRLANGQLDPLWFHGLNLLLHITCCVLVYLLIRQLWQKGWPALLGAMFFAVHPLQIEAVAWASGMYTLLSTALSLAALIAYVTFARSSSEVRTSNIDDVKSDSSLQSSTLEVRRSTLAFFHIATALYVLALLTKAASVSLPLSAAVIDLFILGRPLRKVIRPLSLWILLGIPIVFLAKYFQDVSAIPAPAIWARPIVAMDAVGFYLRKIVLPIHLIPDYGRNPNWVMQHLSLAGFSATVCGVALFCAWLARGYLKWITAAMGLIIAGVAPYLGLTTFDFQYVSTVADRYAYFGMLGVAFLAAGIVIRLRIAGACLLIVIGVWSMLSFLQVQKWRDTSTLFGYTLRVNPNSLVSHNVFGYMAAHQNPPDSATAEYHYLAALRIWPEDAVIHFNLGNLYFVQHPQQAMEQYQLAVKYQPKFSIYRNNLAATFARLNRPTDALEQWRQAITDSPDYVDARNNLADFCLRENQPDMARTQYQAVLNIDSANAHAKAKMQQMNSRTEK